MIAMKMNDVLSERTSTPVMSKPIFCRTSPCADKLAASTMHRALSPPSHSPEVPFYEPSDDPTAAWESIRKSVICREVRPLNASVVSRTKDNIRFVCISDTHGFNLNTLPFQIPDGDVLIHAGDFTEVGSTEEIKLFNKWMGTLPHKHKIVIAGNHDLLLDADSYGSIWRRFHKTKEDCESVNIRELLTNCTYLEDEGMELFGYKIWGSPWQPEFGTWAFNLKRGEECREKWSLIPTDTDILITHSPPVGYGDKLHNKQRAGCVDLLAEVQQRINPTYHVFGHIHENHGQFTDGETQYINASICNHSYKPQQKAICFELPLKK